MKVFVLTSLLIHLTTTATVLKIRKSPLIPESNKLEIKFNNVGQPTDITTDNEITEMRSSSNHLRVGSQSQKLNDFLLQEEIQKEKANKEQEGFEEEEPKETKPNPTNFESPSKIFHNMELYDQPETPSLLEKIQMENQDFEPNNTEVKGEINVVHPNYSHNEKLYSNEIELGGGGKKFVYGHDVTGHVHNLNEYGDEKLNEKVKLFDPTESLEVPLSHLKLKREHNEGEENSEEDSNEEEQESSPDELAQEQELRDIESDLKEAVGESRDESPIVVSPNALGMIIKYLKYLESQEGDVFETDDTLSPQEKIDKLMSQHVDMEERISNLKTEIGGLHDHINILNKGSGREKDIEELEKEDVTLNAELENLELQQLKGDQIKLHEEVEDLTTKKMEMEEEGGHEKELEEIENDLVDKEIEEAELEEEMKKKSLTDFNKEILHLEKEKEVVETVDPESQQVEELGAKIKNFEDEEEEIIDNSLAHQELEKEITEITHDIEHLESENADVEVIEALKEDKDKLVKEDAKLENEAEEDGVVIEKSEEEMEAEEHNHNIEEGEEHHHDTIEGEEEHHHETIEGEEDEQTNETTSSLHPNDAEAILEKQNYREELERNFKIIPHLLNALEDIKDETEDLFTTFPDDKSEIPREGVDDDLDKTIIFFDKLKVVAGTFEIFNEKTKGDLEFVNDIVQNTGLTFDDCLDFYLLRKQYEQAKHHKLHLSEEEVQKDLQIKENFQDYVDKLRSIVRTVESIITFKGLIQEEIKRFDGLVNKTGSVMQEEQDKIVQEFFPKLMDLREKLNQKLEDVQQELRDLKENKQFMFDNIEEFGQLMKADELGDAEIEMRVKGEGDQAVVLGESSWRKNIGIVVSLFVLLG